MTHESEIRKDYIQDQYVLIAPRRSGRPGLERMVCKEALTPASKCHFCPRGIDPKSLIATFGPGNPWNIAVIENLYPAVTLENPKAYGTQEVVIETPNHTEQLDELHEEQIAEVLAAYGVRTLALAELPNLEYILIFKNSGGRAGASMSHSHSQIFATQFLPPHLLDKAQKAQAYKIQNGSCVYCDVIDMERKTPRLVYEDAYVIAFTPYASAHNYEVWILPKRHLDNIAQLNEHERLAWAAVLKRLLRAIDKLKLPYNYYFHQIINDEDQHLYMKITPRGSTWAGVEIGSGLIINPVSPEDAAGYFHGHF